MKVHAKAEKQKGKQTRGPESGYKIRQFWNAPVVSVVGTIFLCVRLLIIVIIVITVITGITVFTVNILITGITVRP